MTTLGQEKTGSLDSNIGSEPFLQNRMNKQIYIHYMIQHIGERQQCVGAVSRNISRSCQGMVGHGSVEKVRADIHRVGRWTTEWMNERQYCLSVGRGDGRDSWT